MRSDSPPRRVISVMVKTSMGSETRRIKLDLRLRAKSEHRLAWLRITILWSLITIDFEERSNVSDGRIVLSQRLRRLQRESSEKICRRPVHLRTFREAGAALSSSMMPPGEDQAIKFEGLSPRTYTMKISA